MRLRDFTPEEREAINEWYREQGLITDQEAREYGVPDHESERE